MLWRKLKLDWRYALGELLIVVVGVLIALAVDSWNESRLDRDTEHQYLLNLLHDLEADTTELNRAMDYSLLHQGSARAVLAAVQAPGESDAGDPSQFLRSVEMAGFLYFPAHNRYTFDDLKSTGNLRLIRDEALKREVAGYYALIERSNQWQENWRGIQRRTLRWMPRVLAVEAREAFTWEQRPEHLSTDPRVPTGEVRGTPEEVNSTIRRLRQDPAIQSDLKDMIWVHSRNQLYLHQIRHEASQLLNLLEAQLGAWEG